MKKTFLEALDILEKTGDETRAWAAAQLDQGLLPGVTQEQWVAWARTLIKRNAARVSLSASITISA